MPEIIRKGTKIESAGNKPKIIEEFIGRVNSGEEKISIARMKSPAGWKEPGQKPDFHEFTIVYKGFLKVETKEGEYEIKEGEVIHCFPGEWVRYSSPGKDGCEYIAICTPAFSPETVNRDS